MVRRAVAWPVRRVGRFIDAIVRWRLGVFVYSDISECFFRVSFGTAGRAKRLVGGEIVGRGDPLVELHLWNERMEGRTVGLELARDLRRSLEELGAYLERVDPGARFRAVHGVVGIVGGRDVERMADILRRFGFETGEPETAGYRVWTGRFWEAFFSRWLLFAFNPRASHRQRLGDLSRFDIWMTRATLRDRYGARQEACAERAAAAPD